MTTSLALADQVVVLLKAANVAGGAVYGVRAWPTQPDQLPLVRLEVPSEDKRSLGRNDAQRFVVVATLPIILQVERPADDDEAGAAAARADLGALAAAVQAAVIEAPALRSLGVMSWPFVRSRARINADGREIIGQWQIDLGLEFLEEFFAPTPAGNLTDIQVRTDANDFAHLDQTPAKPAVDLAIPT